MIVVRIELHSAVTGQVTEIGKLLIANVGGTQRLGNYRGKLLRRKDAALPHVPPEFATWQGGVTVSREATVEGHARLSAPVWRLVGRMLKQLGMA